MAILGFKELKDKRSQVGSNLQEIYPIGMSCPEVSI